MPSKPNTPDPVRILTVRIPDSLRAQLATKAAADGRPLSSYIRRVLLACVGPFADALPIREGRRLVGGRAVARRRVRK